MATAPPSSPRSFNPYDCIDVGCFGVIRAAGTAYAVNRDPGSGRSNIFKIGPGHIQGNPRAGQNCEFILKGTFFMVPGFPFAIPGVSPGPLSRRSGVYITLNDGIKTIGLPDEPFVSSSPYLKICIRTGQINYIVNMGGHGIVSGFSDFEVRRVIGSSEHDVTRLSVTPLLRANLPARIPQNESSPPYIVQRLHVDIDASPARFVLRKLASHGRDGIERYGAWWESDSEPHH